MAKLDRPRRLPETQHSKDDAPDVMDSVDQSADMTYQGAPMVGPKPVIVPETDIAAGTRSGQDFADESVGSDNELPVPRGDDLQTDAAVDDVLQSDSNAALSHDASFAATVAHGRSFGRRLKDAWLDWWQNPWKKWGSILVAVAVVAVSTSLPPVRAAVLNTFGVRSSVIVTVYDGASDLPLKNATVSVGALSTLTDENGKAKLKNIPLGDRQIVVEKTAFAPYRQQARFGMRVVDLGDVTLKAVGIQLTYSFTDYLTGAPISGVSLESEAATAKSDESGKAILTIPPGSTSSIILSKGGYRTEKSSPPGGTKASLAVALVPSAKAMFVTKESGKFDVYRMYVDGRDREVLLPATGTETQNISVLPNSDGTITAVASTRDDKRNSDGFLLTALTLVDSESGEQTAIEHAEDVTLIGWHGRTLVYRLSVAGASAANPNRQRMVAYNVAENKRFQLASGNNIAAYDLIGDTVYYTAGSANPGANDMFARVNINSLSKKSIYTGSVWSLLRTDYEKIKIQTPDRWYDYTIGSSSIVPTTPDSYYTFRYYVDSPDGKRSVRTDARDSNGVLMLRDIATGREKDVAIQRNMQAPLYWLNDSVVVYRVAGAAEVADYVVSVDGGASKKISDVSLTGIR